MGLADPCRPHQRECVPRMRNSLGLGRVRRDQPGSFPADATGGSGETTSATASFLCPERSNLVGLALRPSTPAPREQRQPRREQRAEATDSEAHGIPAGPVFRLRSGPTHRAVRLASLRGRTELRPHGEVGVKRDALKATDAEWQPAPLVLGNRTPARRLDAPEALLGFGEAGGGPPEALRITLRCRSWEPRAPARAYRHRHRFGHGRRLVRSCAGATALCFSRLVRCGKPERSGGVQ